MHIAVLAKVVPDYEVPSGDFELVNKRAHTRYTRMIGLYDENAIETGVQLKEKYKAELSIISYGKLEDITILRKAIAMGGDNLNIIVGESDDPFIIAVNLQNAVEKIGNIDLILAGQQSADMDRGIVHSILAEKLGYTFIPKIAYIESLDDKWTVKQLNENGSRELSFSGKGVLSITSIPENVPRIPPVKSIFAAKKKPFQKIEAIKAEPMEIEEITVEKPKQESVCDFLPLDDMEVTSKMLLEKLRGGRYI